MEIIMNIRKFLRPALFTIGGALVGLGYYLAVGCPTGTCVITSSPVNSMLYMAVVGALLSGVVGKE